MQRTIRKDLKDKLDNSYVVALIAKEKEEKQYGLGQYATDLAEATAGLEEDHRILNVNAQKIKDYLVTATELLVDAAYNFSGNLSQRHVPGIVAKLDALPAERFGKDQVPEVDTDEAARLAKILLAHLQRYKNLVVSGKAIDAAKALAGKDEKEKQASVAARAVELDKRINAFKANLSPRRLSLFEANAPAAAGAQPAPAPRPSGI